MTGWRQRWSGIRAWRDPGHARILVRDALHLTGGLDPDSAHLRAAMEWLCRAQDVTGCGGVSAGYSFRRGWRSPHPETTGYIIPTFLAYGALIGQRSFLDRAIRMGDWEIATQLPSGAVPGFGVNGAPLVFDTGQVLLGWTALYGATGLPRFLDAARRAGDWLVQTQDPRGSWTRHAYHGIAHAYYTRVAWALLKLTRRTGEPSYAMAAEQNIRWALSEARPNGWFNQMSFTRDTLPYTHTVAYTLSGLVESLAYLDAASAATASTTVRSACEHIIGRYELDAAGDRRSPRFLPGTLNEHWESQDAYSCLTGNVQLAIVFLKLHQLRAEPALWRAARHLIDQVKRTQALRAGHPGIRGGIAGSYPVWGGYSPYNYLNWSTKFFADALLVMHGVSDEVG